MLGCSLLYCAKKRSKILSATSFRGGTFRSAWKMCRIRFRPISKVIQMKILALCDDTSG